MKLKGKIGAFIATSFILPSLAFATEGDLSQLRTLVNSIGNIVNAIIPIMFALAIIAFFYGLVKYLWAGEHEKDQAKKTMLWGVVAIFVMTAIWGIVRWIGGAVGVSEDAPGFSPDVDLPEVNGGTQA